MAELQGKTPRPSTPSGATIPAGLIVVSGLFLLVLVYIVASSLSRRALPTFELSPVTTFPRHGDSAVVDTVTVDARDTKDWHFFDFDRRSLTRAPDTTGWDLAFQRFRIRAANGVADMGPVPFDSAIILEAEFVSNTTGSDTVNPAISRWYRYSLLSHLLEPKDHLYVVRTAEGRYAKLTILSYYCPGLQAGCLTFQYRYPMTKGSERPE